MSPIITDAVVIAFIGGIVSIITTRITTENKKNAELITSKLLEINVEIAELKKDVSEVKEIGGENRDGIRNTQRYRLFKEMTRDIKLCYTTLSRSTEISKLYHSYEKLGGNGEIHDLYEIYKKLPVKNGVYEKKGIEKS